MLYYCSWHHLLLHHYLLSVATYTNWKSPSRLLVSRVWNSIWYFVLYFCTCWTRSVILCYIFLHVERALVFCVLFSACETHSGILCSIFLRVECILVYFGIYFCIWNTLWYLVLYFYVWNALWYFVLYIFLHIFQFCILGIIYCFVMCFSP